MKNALFALVLFIFPLTSNAACDQIWFHLAGISKHIEVYEPNEFTRYKRQTHPGFGVECQKSDYILAAGEFTNSLDRPFQYLTAAKNLSSIYKVKLNVGLLAGEYGRTELEPLKMVIPVAYLEYQYQHVGINFFALPPAKNFNDYAIFYTQFKIGF